MKLKAAVVVFPGSNCDQDCVRAWEFVTGGKAKLIWHKTSKIDDFDVVILPGGFSFGDYLRSGAIARFSPIMGEVQRLAEQGKLILGICNGFQILTEAGLLPGSLIRNKGLKYICKDVYVRVENNNTPFTKCYKDGQVLRIPISHGEGNYTIPIPELRKLQDTGRIVLRYSNMDGTILPNTAPNGSVDNIAGIINEEGNVLGIMPHPERVSDKQLGGVDGTQFWVSIVETLRVKGIMI
ncbi:MAG: phosphoribosylformylglycinamidine synthase subunit PurQ [Deltaproteobacteria bacterium]|nr:phosphoribosylformylglycinamidine synthase subunit PurQ [Deltaproteobacteria bacterium]